MSTIFGSILILVVIRGPRSYNHLYFQDIVTFKKYRKARNLVL